MAVEIITSFGQQCDASGDPMSGAKVYVYNVGTTTLRDVFSDSALTPPAAANPIVCDSAGRHDMRYTASGSYKIVVKTSADVTVYTRDNIDGRVPVGSGALAIANGGTGATSAGAALSGLGAATAAELAVLSAEVAAISGSLASTEKTHIATGSTAQRPASPVQGDFRRNTTVPQWEGHNGTGWKYFVSEDEVGTSGAKVGLLNANKTDSGNNTWSGTATYSNAAGITAKNTPKAFVYFQTNGSAVVTIAGSLNVASVATQTVESINGWRVTFTSALPSGNYIVVSNGRVINQVNNVTMLHSSKNTTTFDFVVFNHSTAGAVRNSINVDMVFYDAT